jgi:hypothetical protein
MVQRYGYFLKKQKFTRFFLEKVCGFRKSITRERFLARSGGPFFVPLDNFWAYFRNMSKDGVFVHTS